MSQKTEQDGGLL